MISDSVCLVLHLFPLCSQKNVVRTAEVYLLEGIHECLNSLGCFIRSVDVSYEELLHLVEVFKPQNR